jgi:hypothetical protein
LATIENAGKQAGNDLQLAQSLIQAYDVADAAAKPGILGQINSALNTAESNMTSILPALHISDVATQSKIEAVVGLVVTEVQSLEAIIPIVNPNSSVKAMARATVQAQKTPPLSASAFRTSFNHVMTDKTGNAELDRISPAFAIHEHSKAVRVLTVGIAK